MFLGVVVLAVSATVAAAEKPVVLAKMQRFGCEGTCPEYSLVIYRDGRVDYRGTLYVKQRGRATATLDAKQLAAIGAAFTAAKYFEIKLRGGCADDTPSTYTFYDDGKRKAAIDHDSACDHRGRTAKLREQAAALTVLEAEIDRIVGIERWIGTPAEAAKLQE